MDRRRAGGTPGETPPDDEAIFAIERMPRGRGLRGAAVLILAISGVAIAGALGSEKRPPAAAELALPAGTAAATPGPAFEWGAPKRGDDRYLPLVAAAPLLVVEARADAGSVFVHGDVYTIGADVVVVSLDDVRNRTIDVRRVQLPGGSTAMRTGPNDRFSLLFKVAAARDRQATWVTAVALDDAGAFVASAIVRVE